VVGNTHRGRPQGKCHRNQTANGPFHLERMRARVKRCGKSAPVPLVTEVAGQTPLGATPFYRGLEPRSNARA